MALFVEFVREGILNRIEKAKCMCFPVWIFCVQCDHMHVTIYIYPLPQFASTCKGNVMLFHTCCYILCVLFFLVLVNSNKNIPNLFLSSLSLCNLKIYLVCHYLTGSNFVYSAQKWGSFPAELRVTLRNIKIILQYITGQVIIPLIWNILLNGYWSLAC